MIGISNHHRQLDPEEIPTVTAQLADGWKDPSIPRRQWISVVRGEMQSYREGVPMQHFDVFIRTLKAIPRRDGRRTLLDVGASSGFYREVIEIGGVDVQYSAVDFSEEYKKLAEELYPGIDFKVGDACALPYPDKSFDIVLSGCCLTHICDYEKAISESARVSSEYVIFNRTPVVLSGTTVFYEKQAYGVSCYDIHFDEDELFRLFAKYGLKVVHVEEIFRDSHFQYAHRTYLTRKA